MPKRLKNVPTTSPWDSEVRLLAWLATCVSVLSFLFYFRNGAVLLYGDAVAHINIARRVFDSKTPGLLQLGTVWLPLPHLLMIPFLLPMRMWRSGAGGSIPSMAAYVFGAIGIFRLTRTILCRMATPDPITHLAAWIAAAIYAANPNLIYMQSTAMGESLYLALFIWAVVYFTEATSGDTRALIKCGLCLAAACLTRYDGWFLAAAMASIFVLRAITARNQQSKGRSLWKLRVALIEFLLLAAAAPALWLAYNGIVYRNPLEFENGRYSAKAIERRTQAGGNPGHPGSNNPMLSGLYFLKSAEDNVAENQWLQRAWILLALVAIAMAISASLHRAGGASGIWPLLFLLIPLPFYALSVAYGGVPIFVPQWWPFTHYNVRYGLQLLPAFAVTVALLFYLILRSPWESRLRLASVLVVLAVVTASYISIWRSGPICLQEAEINMRTHNQLDRELAIWLQRLPADSTLLMYLGDHVGAIELAGIPVNHTINEGNHRVWKQPTDVQGLWERALGNPPQYADYVLAFEGDPVWQAVHDLHLPELVDIHVTGQARAVLYRAR